MTISRNHLVAREVLRHAVCQVGREPSEEAQELREAIAYGTTERVSALTLAGDDWFASFSKWK